MFYINNKSQIKNKLKWHLSIAFPAIIVFMALTITLVAVWSSSHELVQVNRQEVVSRRARNVAASLQSQIYRFEDILHASAVFFSRTQSNATAENFELFVRSLNIEERHHGLIGIGKIQIVAESEREQHEQDVRDQENVPDYHIYPASDGEFYASLLHISPRQQVGNPDIYGLDLYSDPNIKSALDQSRDNASSLIFNVHDTPLEQITTDLQADIWLINPVYGEGDTPETVEERRDALVAFHFAMFSSKSFFETTITDEDDYHYILYLGILDSEDAVLYESPAPTQPLTARLQATQLETISVAGKLLTVSATNKQRVLTDQVAERPTRLLYLGAIFIFFVTGFIYLLSVIRNRTMLDREHAGLQEAKDELLALASHQLRTPATGVKQYIGMLREGYAGELTAEQKSLIESAYDSNERQLKIVNEMLFVARLDSGKVSLEHKHVDINAIIKDIVEEMKQEISDSGLSLNLYLPDSPVNIEANQDYLHMAVGNIINNAVKYTRQGGVIKITVNKKDTSVELIVRDNGVGVAEEDLPNLFKKFSRVPNELTGQVSGTGIGLYLVNKIIQAHHGRIVFKSKEGVGSIVAITLPIEQSKDARHQLDISQ